MALDSPPVIWTLPDLFQDTEAAEAAALLAELLDTFRGDSAQRIDHLSQAIQNSDFRKILAEAHSLKGSARQLGAHALADACEEIERRAARGIAPEIDCIPLLQECFTLACRVMNAYTVR